MCRSCDQGGRRCPADAPEKRRARQNAAYHAKKHATGARSPESGNADASADADLPPLEGPVTAEMVRQRVEHAQQVLARSDGLDGGALTLENEHGWRTPTEYGLEAEAATRAAGAAIAARAEGIAAERVADALRSNKDLISYHPDGFDSREQYADYIAQQSHMLKEHVLAVQRKARDSESPEEARELHLMANSQIDEANKLLAENSRVQQGDSAWDRAEAKVYSDAYLEALSEQRSMGLPGGQMIDLDSKSQKATAKRLEKSLAYYPSDWLERDGSYETSWRTRDGARHQKRVPLRVKSTGKRAHYAPYAAEGRRTWGGDVEWEEYSELLIDKRDEGCLGPGVSTALHEYGHRAERVQSRVNELAQTHLARRTSNADGERHDLEPYLVGRGRARSGPSQDMAQFKRQDEGKSEWVRSDDFAERYMGKQNSSRDDSSEVFSTGMEGVFAGRFGGLRGAGRWKEDREHRDFILGTLVSVK